MAGAATLGLFVVALLALQTGAWATVVGPGEYNTTTVKAVDDNGTYLESVHVRIAETSPQQYLGLSNTTSLAENEGMLFAYDRESSHTFVMRKMDFPLDIVFVASNGTVTEIHHAPIPENTPEDDLRSYQGEGQYVLEVDRRWANETGLDEGDHVCVPAGV